MKIYFSFLIAVVALSSCKQNANQANSVNTEIDTLQISKATKNIAAKGFNLDQVAISKQDIGKFPYLFSPAGYQQTDAKEKQMEEKYFFYNDSLVRKVSGQYYQAKVFNKEGKVFEDTYLVNAYKTDIEKLGGMEFYVGGLPALAAQLIDTEKPAYVADMYDPRPYKYKQYLIRRPKENIWIELCHGLNANQIDLTVVREEIAEGK